jgi:hypothetical protein
LKTLRNLPNIAKGNSVRSYFLRLLKREEPREPVSSWKLPCFPHQG